MAEPGNIPPAGDPPADPSPLDGGIKPPPMPDPEPDPAPPTDDELKFSKAAFKQRMERERTKASEEMLKSMGFESMEQWKEWKENADKASKAQKEQERQKLSELERYKADLAERDKKLAEEQAAREAATAEAEAARVEAHLAGVFARKGITNSDYAFFKLESKLNQLNDGEELDEEAFLDELLADPSESIALGVAAPDSSNPRTVPLTTQNPKKGPAPKQPDGEPPKHASQMSDDEWVNFKKQHGLNHT